MARKLRSVDLVRTSKRKRHIRKILIVCEGEKTEPSYFKKFPEKPEVFDILDVKGIGNNTIFVVNKAIDTFQNLIVTKTTFFNNLFCHSF